MQSNTHQTKIDVKELSLLVAERFIVVDGAYAVVVEAMTSFCCAGSHSKARSTRPAQSLRDFSSFSSSFSSSPHVFKKLET
mmetsp:Transcript_68922/g.193366  ORF Transcript_68922/g.193366 Transcript_68922/m.193366 type:complete len:81 (-) Transcript_68922:512-754(-)